MRTKKFLAMAIALGLAVGMTAMPTLAAEKKTLVFGRFTAEKGLHRHAASATM